MSQVIDDREVESHYKRKSFSFERTFENDLITVEQCHRWLSKLRSKNQKKL